MIPESTLEKLNTKKADIVFKVKLNQEGFVSYVIVFPIQEVKEQKYKNNLLPILSYEVRYIRHKNMYSYAEWGDDYDYVLGDVTTRIKRIFINRSNGNHELALALSQFDIDLNDFSDLQFIYWESALVSTPIDSYIENHETFPHLWLDD